MDKYDKQISEIMFSKNPADSVYIAWGYGHDLFQYTDRGRDLSYGCLTMVRNGERASVFFTDEIAADKRLHDSPYSLKNHINKAKTYQEIVEILYPYAEWQRKIDAEFEKINQ